MHSPPTSIKYVLRWLALFILVYALLSLGALFSSQQLIASVSALPLTLLGEFILLITASFALRTARWCYLTRRLNPQVPLRVAAEIYIGGFPMTLTPGRIGELWRAWALVKQHGSNYRRCLPLVLCDRLLDLNILLLFAALGIVATLSIYRLPAVAALLLILPFLLLLLKPNWCRQILKILWFASGKRLSRQFAALLAICRCMKRIVHPATYLPALLLSLFAWLIEAFAIYHIAMQLGGTLLLANAMTILGLGNIVGVLTFLPGGIGGQEATLVYLLQQSGNTLSLALIVTGVARIGTIFYAALLGLPFFIKYSRLAKLSLTI
ncbi:MAG: flippase-like domain-containing protein [Proteobacteria bacterium]|nr:flippase-like domain-containing protein [Pseudomonadota bacterium]